MKYIKLIFSLTIFITITYLAFNVVDISDENKQFKKDHAELNHFKYGIFNVDTWKVQLSGIIADEIDKLSLKGSNQKFLRTHLERQLEILIDKVNHRIKTKNMKTMSGQLKQSLMEVFVDIKDVKKGIPEYAKAMLGEVSSPKTERKIKGLLKQKVNTYLSKTHDNLPSNARRNIILKYGNGNEELANQNLNQFIQYKNQEIEVLSQLILFLAVLMFVFEIFNNKPLPPYQYILLTGTLMVLLFVGVFTPMIEMEAKISQLSFVLMDHPIEFKEQILYFQSKSIIDVFNVMIHHKQLQMKFVGILMVSFSIIFPLIKMICSMLYYYNVLGSRYSSVINFFVMKSGKWSMADVLVVAIFMAYIGFNGIINSQLGNIEAAAQSVDVLTTNGTSLQPGFYLFFSYAILAMYLSGFLKSRPYMYKEVKSKLRKSIEEEEQDIKVIPYPNDKERPLEQLH